MLEINKVMRFFESNKWRIDDVTDEYHHYVKPGNISISVSTKEIVLINDNGDFCHIPMSKMALYALIGKLICIRAIAMDFIYPEDQ